MYITNINLQNVLFKFSLQAQIESQKVTLTIFFAIPTNCNFPNIFLHIV